MYHCDSALDKLYELDINTLVNLSGSGVNSPGSLAMGIGGIFNRLYHCDSASVKLYELDINTLANLSDSGVNSPGSSAMGIGGIKHCSFHIAQVKYNNNVYDLLNPIELI